MNTRVLCLAFFALLSHGCANPQTTLNTVLQEAKEGVQSSQLGMMLREPASNVWKAICDIGNLALPQFFKMPAARFEKNPEFTKPRAAVPHSVLTVGTKPAARSRQAK